LSTLFSLIEANYENPDVIFELIGEETMRIWYEAGEGHGKISKGIDFLKYQTGSEGYWSMVKGPKDKVGELILSLLSEKEGTAELIDTSPFHHAFVKGILLGGMKGGGDLMRLDIRYSKEKKAFHVTFR
jgi:hypothetical protein